MPINDLYLTILPLIHISQNRVIGFGLTEQTLTLVPDRDWATEFFEDEVDGYVATFENRADKYLTGGHVLRYECVREPAGEGRVIVRVIQHVR